MLEGQWRLPVLLDHPSTFLPSPPSGTRTGQTGRETRIRMKTGLPVLRSYSLSLSLSFAIGPACIYLHTPTPSIKKIRSNKYMKSTERRDSPFLQHVFFQMVLAGSVSPNGSKGEQRPLSRMAYNRQHEVMGKTCLRQKRK